jgi:hypothetical protein
MGVRWDLDNDRPYHVAESAVDEAADRIVQAVRDHEVTVTGDGPIGDAVSAAVEKAKRRARKGTE